MGQTLMGRTIRVTIVGDATSVQQAFGNASRSLSSFGRAAGRIAGVVGLGAMISKMTEVIKVTAEMSAAFEIEMAKIVGLTNLSEEQVAGWSDQILDLAVRVGKSPQELAEAMFFLASAGLEVGQEMNVLEASAKAAAAGLGDTKTVADVVTSVLNAYGSEAISATEATDVLAAAIREGKSEPDELAGTIGRVLPIASEMGVEFHEVAAAIAAMSQLGLDSAEATTALRSALFSLLKPSRQAEKELARFGTSSAELRKSLREEGLLVTLMKLRGILQEDETAFGRIFANVRGLTGVLNLIGENAESVTGIFDRMGESTGFADDAFNAVAETSGFKLQQQLVELQVVGTRFGATTLPIVIDALGRLTDVAITLTEAGGPLDQLGRFLTRSIGALPWASDATKNLAAVIEAQDIFFDHMEKGTDPVLALADSIAWLNHNGALTADTFKAFTQNMPAADLERLKEILESLDTGSDPAGSFTEAFERLFALTGNRDFSLMLAEYAGEWQDLDRFVVQAAQSHDEMSGAARGTKHAIAGTGSEQEIFNQILEETQDELGDTSGDLVTLEEKLLAAKDAGESLATVLLEAADPAFAALQAETRLDDAINRLSELKGEEDTTQADLDKARTDILEAALRRNAALETLGEEGAFEDALSVLTPIAEELDIDIMSLLERNGITENGELVELPPIVPIHHRRQDEIQFPTRGIELPGPMDTPGKFSMAQIVDRNMPENIRRNSPPVETNFDQDVRNTHIYNINIYESQLTNPGTGRRVAREIQRISDRNARNRIQ